MTDERHLSFDEIRAAARDLGERRRKARMDYSRRVEEAADAERDYRKNLAVAFTRYRTEEKGVGESEILAKGDTANEAHRRDVAQGLAKAALLRIEELEADRAMLRQLGDWSQRMEGVAA